MRHRHTIKQTRKNFQKERIFTQKQNKEDFDYVKEHRGKVDGDNPQIQKEKQRHKCTCC